MLIPLHDGRLLLPNAAVAEIIGYRDPQPLDGAPPGVMGLVTWRQREVTVIDFERLRGAAPRPPSVRQRIAVCYGPDPLGSSPLVGLLTQGIPRLLHVSRAAIDEASVNEGPASPLRLHLTVGDERLTVPDLAYLQAAAQR
jgi:chemosensory pili system protein ChpC